MSVKVLVYHHRYRDTLFKPCKFEKEKPNTHRELISENKIQKGNLQVITSLVWFAYGYQSKKLDMGKKKSHSFDSLSLFTAKPSSSLCDIGWGQQ